MWAIPTLEEQSKVSFNECPYIHGTYDVTYQKSCFLLPLLWIGTFVKSKVRPLITHFDEVEQVCPAWAAYGPGRL